MWAVCRPLTHIKVLGALRGSGGVPGGLRGASGGSGGPLGGLWGAFGEVFGVSWRLLGRLVAQEAPRNHETRSQDTARTRLRGPRWPPGGPQEGPTCPQEGAKTVPRGIENDIQEKKAKTSKSTTLSTEKLDF